MSFVYSKPHTSILSLSTCHHHTQLTLPLAACTGFYSRSSKCRRLQWLRGHAPTRCSSSLHDDADVVVVEISVTSLQVLHEEVSSDVATVLPLKQVTEGVNEEVHSNAKISVYNSCSTSGKAQDVEYVENYISERKNADFLEAQQDIFMAQQTITQKNQASSSVPPLRNLNTSSDETSASEQFRCFYLDSDRGTIRKDQSLEEILGILSQEQYQVEEISDLPVKVAAYIGCFFSLSLKKEKGQDNQDTLQHCNKIDTVQLPAFSESLKQFSKCSQEKEIDFRSIPCLESFSGPLDLILKDGSSLFYKPRQAEKFANSNVWGPFFKAGDPLLPSAFTEVLECRGKRIVKVKAMGRGLYQRIDMDNKEKFVEPNLLREENSDDPSAYFRAYNDYLKYGRLKHCVELLESMQGEGLLDMNKVSHASFLNACKNKKAVEEAIRFGKLIENPKISIFNALLSICAHSRDFDGAFQVMLLLKEAGLKPDCRLYTTLISTCAKCGKVDAMFEIFHEMVNSGIEPTVQTYGALIDGCAKAGQVAKAFGAYGIMSSKNVKPDRIIFNALISACGESRAVDRAFDVLAEMTGEPKPILPDHVTVGALMKTCINAGQVDRAHQVYKMLEDYKIKGTSEVYTIALRSCSLTGDLKFALEIYKDIKKNCVPPDEIFFSAFADVAGHAGKVEIAFEIIRDARAKGLEVGAVAYSSLMGACCNAKNWQMALELYEEIKSIKLKPTVSMLNALITSLCEGGQLTTATKVLVEMKKFRLRSNEITYSVLIVACEKKGETEIAFMLFEQAKTDRIRLNLTIVGCLTDLCLQSFQKDCSYGDTVVKFNSGRPQISNRWNLEALKVYREARSAGLSISSDILSQVLGCFKFPHDSTLKDKFIENIGIVYDVSKRPNVNSLLEGFGEYDGRAFSILEEAASLGVVPCLPFEDSPITVDARKLRHYTAEVYVLVVLRGLKTRLAAGARLPNMTILLPTEKTEIELSKGERAINIVGRAGQAVCSLLRRLGISYQGVESHGKIRILGLTLRRWFQPKYTSSADMLAVSTRLAKGITDQQRSIRSSNNLSLE